MSRNYLAVVKTFTYQTKARLEFLNISSDLENFIEESGVKTGTVTIATHHTTCSLWVNEDEKNLIGPRSVLDGVTPDLHRALDRFADPNEKYGHNDVCDARNPAGRRDTHLCEPDENGLIQECINGHAHAQALMLHASITLIIKDGQWQKGKWQQLLLVELDHDRKRQLTMLAQGIDGVKGEA